MHGITRTVGIAFSQAAVALAILLSWQPAPPPASASPGKIPRPGDVADAHLVLSVEPAKALAGTLITLHIQYQNIGLPYTLVFSNPSGLVAFDPALTMPCRYFEHPSGCRDLTLRTLSAGVVQFNAVANGEVFDEKCGCWYFTNVSDNGAALLEISAPAWRLLLPAAYR